MSTVRTVDVGVDAEIDRIRGSRFVAVLRPATTEPEALTVVEDVRSRWPDASHHCWAYRLSRGRQRSDDDGEPRDTAGAPILRHLEGADLVDVVCVVTRWYGGTNLGRGGLVRAYGDATGAAIARAEVVERALATRLVIEHPYDLSARVNGVLADFAVVVTASEYASAVTIDVMVVDADVRSFVRAVLEATSGRVRPVPPGEE